MKLSMDRLKIVRHGTQSSNSTDEGDNIDTLPFDLISEIFSRLPARSIAICRSVTKQWFCLLRRPDFTLAFLTRSSTRPHLLLALKYGTMWHFFSCTPPQNFDRNISVVSADYHMCFSGDWYNEVCQCVNGLIFLMEKRIVNEKIHRVPVICNPSRGQLLTLPSPRAKNLRLRSFFGYDPIGKEYKVLCMTVAQYRNQINSREHQILTLGTPKLSWRKLECSFPHYPESMLNGLSWICINGVLYYKAWFEQTLLISCFDIRSEKFSYIETPDSCMQISITDLMNYKGKLGFLMHGYDGAPRELWVLNDTEKDKQWKQISDWPNAGYEMKKAIWITDKGELGWVRKYWTTPFCVNYYNLETATHRILEIKGIDEKLGMGQDLPSAHFIFIDFIENLMLL